MFFGLFLKQNLHSRLKLVRPFHFEKGSRPNYCGKSSFSNYKSCIFQPLSRRSFSKEVDKNTIDRRKKLTVATYVSCFIGAVLLSAIGLRKYKLLKYKAIGIEPVKERLYGRRPFLFSYRGFAFVSFVVDNIRDLHTFKVRHDDIWVVTFPKAGTTWVQEIVYLIMNDADVDKADQTNMDEKFPYLEFPYPDLNQKNNLPSPRYIKTHLPFSLLPNDINKQKPKVIYVMRNPKDTAVSFYNFSQNFFKDPSFIGNFDEYCQCFLDGKVGYGPWWKHVKEAWLRRNDDNILVLKYEDLQKDKTSVIQEIAAFLNKSLTSAQVETISRHCSFNEMKNNRRVNYDWLKEIGLAADNANFMRKGETGDWTNHIKPEIANKFDEMVAEKLAPYGLTFVDFIEK